MADDESKEGVERNSWYCVHVEGPGENCVIIRLKICSFLQKRFTNKNSTNKTCYIIRERQECKINFSTKSVSRWPLDWPKKRNVCTWTLDWPKKRNACTWTLATNEGVSSRTAVDGTTSALRTKSTLQ